MSASTVLVVDDDPDLRETVVDALEIGGYKTLSAAHGREALDLLLSLRDLPDVILLDQMMPVMDGLTFAREARKDPRLAGLPIIIFTAHSDHERMARAVEAAASLPKPFQMAKLLSVVGAVVGRSNERRPSPESPGG